MAHDNGTANRLIGLYGGVARRLAHAITGSRTRAERIVREAAESCGDGAGWVELLEAARERSLAQSTRAGDAASAPAALRPEDPGSSPIPLESTLLYDAFAGLTVGDRELLWNALLGRTSEHTDPEALATALARLNAAVTAAAFPSEEDIP
jgi:hypothetical protein